MHEQSYDRNRQKGVGAVVLNPSGRVIAQYEENKENMVLASRQGLVTKKGIKRECTPLLCLGSGEGTLSG